MHKFIMDSINKKISLDGCELNTVDAISITPMCDGRSCSKVTITFRADVTLIPPDREKDNTEMQNKTNSKRRFCLLSKR